MTKRLLIFGLGYTGAAIAAAAAEAGWAVDVTSRRSATLAAARVVPFADAAPAIAKATAVLTTVAPGEDDDPVLRHHGDAIARAPGLRWVGVLSSTAVYGDRDGGAVTESSAPRPRSERAVRRVGAEAAWQRVAGRRSLDVFRLAGIYGPGRSAFDELRAGRARRIDRPGHLFNRIHRDDIVGAVLAAMAHPQPGRRILHGADACPASSAAVIAEAASLLGLPPPPPVPFAEAWATMSPTAREFWSESRRVDSTDTVRSLGIAWRYPSYREGLRAILAAEGCHATDRAC